MQAGDLPKSSSNLREGVAGWLGRRYYSMKALLLLPFLSLCYAEWKNDIIKRTVYLSSAVVREDLTITATPLVSTDRYLVKLAPGKKVVAYKAVQMDEKNADNRNVLEMTEIPHDEEEYVEQCLGPNDERYRCFWVRSASKWPTNKRVEFIVGLAYRNMLRPVPEEAEQNSPLALLYEDSAHVLTPYPTGKQKTSVAINKAFKILAKSAPLPHQLDKPTTAQGLPAGLVQYSCGVYEDVGSHSTSATPLRFHFHLHDAAFATIVKLDRSLTVLPWFNLLTVHEEYVFHHDGFKSTRFERSQFLKAVQQRDAHVQYIGAMPIIVPASAYDIEVRDENGRLTGNHQRQKTSPLGPNYHQFNVAMRYPLTGGWSTHLQISYKLPLDLFLTRSDKTGHFELSTLLFASFFDVAVKELNLRFNLPEDATVKSYHYDHVETAQISEHQSTYMTYFSTKGEQVLELQMADLCRNHVQPIRIVYSYPWWGAFRKPAAILLTLLFVIFCFHAGASVNLSTPSKDKSQLMGLLKLRRETVASLDDLICQLDKPDAQAKCKALQKDLNDCTAAILSVLRAMVQENPAISIQGAALKKLYQQHLTCLNTILDNLRKGPAADISQLEKDVIELDQTILKQEAKLFK